MPGGYDGYLNTLRIICTDVDDLKPTSSELVSQMCRRFSITDTASRLRESFLRKAGFIEVEAGTCQTGSWARGWLDSGDDFLAIALLHSRCRFIGEMIAELQEPKTTEDLLYIVNSAYGLVWDTKTQLSNRRGWLQSAGYICADADGRLAATPAGLEAISRLEIFRPETGSQVNENVFPSQPSSYHPVDEPVPAPGPADILSAELISASIDSSDPDRFERAVRDAFSFMGFEAEWLGGSGKTDVLVDAPLGRDEAYRSTVDAKTTASGALGEHQVDWTTLVEHRTKHDADYALLVAPNPSEGRLMNRACDHGVAVLSAVQLAGSCRQHARSLFALRTTDRSSIQVDPLTLRPSTSWPTTESGWLGSPRRCVPVYRTTAWNWAV